MGVVTMTLAKPATPAGVVHVIEVADTTVIALAALPLNVTLEVPVKFVPLIVTVVPPDVGPVLGSTPVTVGALGLPQVLVEGSKTPPVFVGAVPFQPPQAIMRPPTPVHTAVCCARGEGAPEREVGNQVSPVGSYKPPESVETMDPAVDPPQTTMRLPVHTPVWYQRALGAPVSVVLCQFAVDGLYRPPVFTVVLPGTTMPPQSTIREPVQTAVWLDRPAGAPVAPIVAQVSVDGCSPPHC